MLVNLRKYRLFFFVLALLVTFFIIGVAKTVFSECTASPCTSNCVRINAGPSGIGGDCVCYPFGGCSDTMARGGDHSLDGPFVSCYGSCTSSWCAPTPCRSNNYCCWIGTYVFTELLTVDPEINFGHDKISVFCQVPAEIERCNISGSGGSDCPPGKNKWNGVSCSCNPDDMASCASNSHNYDTNTCECLFGNNELRDACLDSGGDWDSFNNQCTCRFSLISSLFVAFPACNCQLELMALHYNGAKEFLRNPPASLYKRTYENNEWVSTYLFDFPGKFSLLLLDPNNYYLIEYSGFTGIGCGANFSSSVSFEYAVACVVGGCLNYQGGGGSPQQIKKLNRFQQLGIGGYEQRN